MPCLPKASFKWRRYLYVSLCVTLFSMLVSGQQIEECPQEWYFYWERQLCFLLDATQTLSWKEARDACRSYGGDLTTISDSKTNTFLKGLIPSSCAEYWIGLHDTITENVFKWLDEERETNFTYWAPDEPNNLGDEDCVFISAQGGGNWNDATCDSHLGFSCQQAAKTANWSPTQKPTDLFGTSFADWHLAFRGTARVHKSVYEAYLHGSENVEAGCKQTTDAYLPCFSHYRSSILDNWRNITEVAFVIYQSGVMQKYAIFDGRGTDYLNWFRSGKLKSSSWSDLKGPHHIFSISGDSANRRRFFMNYRYSGCIKDAGWFAAVDRKSSRCQWARNKNFPMFLYANSDTKEKWEHGNVARADVIAVYVKYKRT